MNIELKVLLGGCLLGLAAGIMLLVRGRILGCSGMLYRSVVPEKRHYDIDSICFVLGLFISGLLFNFSQTVPDPLAVFKTSLWALFIGGLLVGAGTFLGNGCTSGHGLCGMALMRKRSIVAVSLFFPVAIITAWLTH